MNKLLPSVKSLITLAALLCFLFQASAASAQKVSLSVRNATVKAAIERLQKDYGYSFVIKTKDADVKNILVLQNWLERIRKEVTNKVLSIKRISEFLNFPILAQPTLKKI